MFEAIGHEQYSDLSYAHVIVDNVMKKVVSSYQQVKNSRFIKEKCKIPMQANEMLILFTSWIRHSPHLVRLGLNLILE